MAAQETSSAPVGRSATVDVRSLLPFKGNILVASLLVAMPFALSSVLAPISSNARSP